ncbi:MAG TPA: peptidase S10 [Acetobacteraceae bacterium]|nr:peptidase S10 [Acetobacteraceae bacterium]
MTLLRTVGAAALLLASSALATASVAATPPPAKQEATPDTTPPDGHYFKPQSYGSEGSVTIGGQAIDYHAVVGTLVVHPKDWDDAPQKPAGDDGAHGSSDNDKNPTAEAAMSYVAYFKKGAPAAGRPIMFLYNGGPGSSTVWLHMGAFGPKRVVTLDDSHDPAAPYQLVNNDSSLLDASDLVFIDAPGTGFGRIAGPNKEKSFWGVDADAHAFAEFITAFLTKYGRWDSPKYLFGESYGTTRSAVLANALQQDDSVDLNGVILLSQVLNFDDNVDEPELNPGDDMPYVLALPTYAATAWYHKKLDPMPTDLPAFLKDVESFATYDYLLGLQAGAALPPDQRAHLEQKLHEYTGLPIAYLEKANLRVDGGEFEKTLQDSSDTTTGRLDTRFSGPTMDPLSKEADYDPQSAAISSAYVDVFNEYVRHDLRYAGELPYKPEIDVFRNWNFTHTPPGNDSPALGATNVMPDLATAMKYNPNLRVLVNGGYYDLATPYFAAQYELRHLQIPQKLFNENITFKTYASGHMVYAHAPALKALHDNVAAFVTKTDNEKK